MLHCGPPITFRIYVCKNNTYFVPDTGRIDKVSTTVMSSRMMDISINYYKLLRVIMGLQDARRAVLVKITLVAIVDKIQNLSWDLTSWRFISYPYNGPGQELIVEQFPSKQWLGDLVHFSNIVMPWVTIFQSMMVHICHSGPIRLQWSRKIPVSQWCHRCSKVTVQHISVLCPLNLPIHSKVIS